MAIPLHFELTIEKPLDMSKRAWQSALKEAHQAAAELWREEMLPQHFTSYAAGKYGYKPRSQKYLAAKRRAAARGTVRDGGTIPLVYSGAMRDYSLSTGVARGYPTRFTVTIDNPAYVRINPRNPRMPNMMAEQTAVIQQELDRLAEVVTNKISAAIERYTERQTHKT